MDWLKSIFTPNKSVPINTTRFIIGFQTILFMAFWAASPTSLFPNPKEVFISLQDLWSQGLAGELMTSFYLNVQAIFWATLCSLFLAYLICIPFFRPLIQFFSKLRFLSLVGLSFFFTLMATSGHELKLSLLVFSVSVFFVTSMADVLDSIPKEQFDLARTLRMSEWRIVWEVIVLGQGSRAFDVLRQNAAIGWMMLTMVESTVKSEGGIGSMLMDQNHHFHLSAVFAIQLTILALGLFQDYAIGFLKDICCPYAKLTLERK